MEGFPSRVSSNTQPQAESADPSRLWTARPLSHTEGNEHGGNLCAATPRRYKRPRMPGGTSQASPHTARPAAVSSQPGTQNLTSLMTPNSSGVAAAPVLTPLGGMSGTLSEIKTTTQHQGWEAKRTLSQEVMWRFSSAQRP